ncbi:MAG: hypothetical protein ACYTG7_10710 [Planctomycetota bacterium]
MWSLAGRFGIVLLALLPALQIFSCATTETPKPPVPENLPPIMQALRRASRDFKRALVLDNRDLYAERADSLAAAAKQLPRPAEPPGFSARAGALEERSSRLFQAVRAGASKERLSFLFSETIAGCLLCHHRFRP